MTGCLAAFYHHYTASHRGTELRMAEDIRSHGNREEAERIEASVFEKLGKERGKPLTGTEKEYERKQALAGAP